MAFWLRPSSCRTRFTRLCRATSSASFQCVIIYSLLSPLKQISDILLLSAATASQANISYSYEPDRNPLRTLSTTDAPNRDIISLLYVPTLSQDSKCNTTSHIPANVTRKHNLPPGFAMIALAPWLTPQCTLDFLEAASRDAEIEAFLFYLPDNGTEVPPPANSPVWSLGDGGLWKTKNRYPVYALPGDDGAEIMNALNSYSGNVTSVPHGGELLSLYHPSDYVRLAIEIDTGEHSLRPSLWVFLLVVLAILLVVVSVATCTLRWLQRKRRNRLRQRVLNGEIDLETLGVKRLAVPQDVLEKIPVFVYNPPSPPPSNVVAPPAANPATFNSMGADIPETKLEVPIAPSPVVVAPIPATMSNLGFLHQPTCAICLDDFTPSVTPVRQLPCAHIYHPSCIDAFLRENSSLCPLCKKSVLPAGYCPEKITNLMVRRARAIEQRNAARHTSVVFGDGNHNDQNAATTAGRLPPTGPRSTISAATNNTNTSVRSGFGRGWGLADALPELLTVSSQRTWRDQQLQQQASLATNHARNNTASPAPTTFTLSNSPLRQHRPTPSPSPAPLTTATTSPRASNDPVHHQDQQHNYSIPPIDPPPYSSPTLPPPQQHVMPFPASSFQTGPAEEVDASASRRDWVRDRARAFLGSRPASIGGGANATGASGADARNREGERKGLLGWLGR